MNVSHERGLLAISFFAAGVLVGAVWLGFGDLAPVARPWSAAAMTVIVMAVTAFIAFSQARTPSDESESDQPRPDLSEPSLPQTARGILAALERVVVLLEYLVDSVDARQREETGLAGGPSGSGLAEAEGEHAESPPDAAPDSEPALSTEEADEPVAAHEAEGEETEVVSHPPLQDVLVKAWRRYLRDGDGHFNAEGFKSELSGIEIGAEVREGSEVGAGDAVLVIEDPRSDDRSFFVVPNFTKAPRAAADWFEDESGGILGHRTKELRRLARGRWLESGPEIIEKGIVA